ncbi:MAG: HNH endonuclease [Chitinophagaceae bacterium]|nr:MAG: HNH endonuclease [Chitinophagaceae bacterium]
MSKVKALRERVYNKYSGHCAYCGQAIAYKQMQIDHYLPQCRERYYAGRCKKDVHAEENLMPACRRCNHYKRARTPKQFRELMTTLHERLATIYILKVAVDFGMAEIRPFDGKFYFEKMQALRTIESEIVREKKSPT